ncbi:hypothetical protein CIY_10280 [Butyrivibrio fibrisolvens 16/4]|nr:hypothetical protein CIY_10280 [Butyrivibrio fibrisolvens 16/4]
MNISGIRPSNGFYEKNSRKIGGPESSSPVEETKPVEDIAPVINNDRDVAASLTISDAGKAAAKNIKNAVINMEKDTSIHRYQYFVKDRQNIASSDDKGLENFSL